MSIGPQAFDRRFSRRAVAPANACRESVGRYASDGPSAVASLKRAGFLIIMVTNQSGVSRGYLDASTLADIHEHVQAELTRSEASLDAIYFCPHMPDSGCTCRKPAPGMIQQAAREWQIDLGESFMVGDADSDVAAGHAAGCTAVRITGSSSGMSVDEEKAEYLAANLEDAARWILGVDRC